MEFVRPATSDDIDELSKMYKLCIAEQEGTRGAKLFAIRESLTEPYEPHFANALESDDFLVCIGGIDDVVLGFVLAHVESLRDGSKHVVIDAIFVEDQARAVGVGELLMEQVIAWGSAAGAKTFDAYALPGDRNTKNFFEMSAFTARLIVMHHNLER